MDNHSSRRDFLKTSIAVGAAALSGTAGASMASPAPEAGHIKKALQIEMLPKNLSYADRMKLVKAVGFDAIEGQTVTDQREAEEIKQAADDAKVRIHSVMNMAHWENPLSSPDPAVVNPQVSYRDAWTCSQKQIKKLLPLAEELKVVIAIEEVWNKFLLSPLEMPKYVDEFQSPWVKSYFDVGNVVLYGYPQDWIHNLGKRIAKVHLKDFKHVEDGYRWVNLGEGEIDWPAVRKAFADVGYTGYVTTELPGGDEAYLRDVGKRVDRLVLGMS